MKKIISIGHRGAKGYKPENTLPSFKHAMDLGCDWLELDVYFVSGELLVIHDKSVDRTTNGKGNVEDLPLDYLRSLDAGDGAPIPTLNEVLCLVNSQCGVNVELKGKNTAQPVSEVLANYDWPLEKFLLSSFNHKELAKSDPLYRRGALFEAPTTNLWKRAEELKAWSVNFYLPNVTPQLVREAQQRGYKVLVYTVNELAEIKRMLNLGVDGIFSDYPDRVNQVRGYRR